MSRFLFVGEKRSTRAIRLGVRWEDGRLSGKTLHEALRACGVDPAAEQFMNLFREGRGLHVDRAALRRVRAAGGEGLVVVAMGCKVQEALERAGVRFVPLVHPAARGLIRTRAVYQAHVASVIGDAARRCGSPAWMAA